MTKLYVFSSNSCVPCKNFKNNLKKNHIDFIEKNFDTMDDKDRQWANQFKVKSLPTSIFIDENNKVKNYLPGTVPIDVIKRNLH